MEVSLHQGDSLDILKEMSDNSVDSIVTDPPYGLSFMGKKWDYDVPSVEIWEQCLRVLKPGGHLLAFAGTRTQHRMAVNIEDAGFEIRDMIAWVYGSGFPKSMNVGKAIDKAANERPVFDAIRAHIRHWRDLNGYDNKGLNEAVSSATNGCGMARHWTSEVGTQHAIPSKDQWLRLKEVLGWPDCEFDAMYESIKDGADRPVLSQRRGEKLRYAPGQGTERIETTINTTAAATAEAQQWDGWGTALKPALEPITVARKPFKGTVAGNVLEHGTGAINIDGCRVAGVVPRTIQGQSARAGEVYGADQRDQRVFEPHNAGRWPANLIHDGSDEVTQLFPDTKSGNVKAYQRANRSGWAGPTPEQSTFERKGDSGSAARFFYCAKANKKDRGEGNNHPTVKPTDLMAYLVRLVTPPGGVVLDPFMGSGSTGKACKREGFNFIGCDLDPDFVELARKRIEEVKKEDA